MAPSPPLSVTLEYVFLLCLSADTRTRFARISYLHQT